MEQANVLIIGGGVVGCAVAEALSRNWQDVFLVEQYPKFGMATSTRNSGVIHSGIYYATNSWKAKHCVAGNRMTKEFCVKHNVPHRTCGKMVVAKNPQEEADLLALKKKGEENGVEGLRMMDVAEMQRKEPHVHGTLAMDVPSTGICSSEELVHAYARVAEGQGANLVKFAKVTAMEPMKDVVRVTLRIGDEADSQEETIDARCVVNSAGLYADEVAAMLGPRAYKIYPVRGEYCELRGAKSEMIHNLVYPMPHHDGLSLGLHLTKTLWGTTLLGPTAKYVDSKENYERDRMTIAEFAADAKALLPELKEEDLQLAYSGLRPKLTGPGSKAAADFIIEADKEVPRVVQLVGIDSPGLTASPAIAEHVMGMVAGILG